MRRALLAAAAALAAAACATDPYGDPLPGREARIVLLPGGRPASAAWPVPWLRGAEFLVENRTGEPVETLILDFTGKGAPRELDAVEILEPPGKPATILLAPHAPGSWPLRARLGDPGSVLLAPGETLRLRVHVKGSPGASRAVVAIPGVTEE